MRKHGMNRAVPQGGGGYFEPTGALVDLLAEDVTVDNGQPVALWPNRGSGGVDAFELSADKPVKIDSLVALNSRSVIDFSASTSIGMHLDGISHSTDFPMVVGVIESPNLTAGYHYLLDVQTPRRIFGWNGQSIAYYNGTKWNIAGNVISSAANLLAWNTAQKKMYVINENGTYIYTASDMNANSIDSGGNVGLGNYNESANPGSNGIGGCLARCIYWPSHNLTDFDAAIAALLVEYDITPPF